jgi:putative ABC transport system permease protein
MDMMIEDLMAQGFSKEEAETEATNRFGDMGRIREEATRQESRRQREMRLADRFDTLFHDIRYAVRALLRSPGMAFLTILILAVGIGANAAIFSVLKAVFLQPLPFPQADELTFVWNRNIRTGGRGPSTFPDYQDWRDQNLTFDDMGAFSGLNLNLTGGEEPVRIRAAQVTSSVFEVLDISPSLGRTFLSEEDLSGRRVVVLSYPVWMERFEGDPGIVGKTIQIDGGGYEVVGVMPEGFEHPTPWGLTDPYLAWIPIRDDPWRASRNSYNYQIVARLRDGVTLEQGQEDLDRIGAILEEEYPDTNENDRAWVVPVHTLLYGDAGSTIILVLLAAGAVLLIACGNIAGFLLARAANRRTEMAVRASLGAGQGRIVRQLLTESLLLALAGGTAAVVLAHWSMGGLKALIPPTLPRTGNIQLDGGVLLFALSLSLATGVIFGLAPAISASKTRLTEALKEGGRSMGAGRKRLRSQYAFVVAQIALSLCLANAGLLLIQSYSSLRGLEQGFDEEHTLTMGISLGGDKYNEPEERRLFFDQLHARLAAIPGVRSAGFTSKLPLRGGTNGPTVTEEQFTEDPTVEGTLTEITSVRGDYFASIGIPLLLGRELIKGDSDTVVKRVVINEAAAERFWPDQDPLGKRFGFEGDNPDWVTVVGIVGNVRQWGPGSTPRPELFWDYLQDPRTRMFITLNAEGDPRSLIRPARAAVLAVDPEQPVSEIQTMEELVESDLSGREFYTLLVGAFSALAVLLAAAGVYGAISYFVVQRTHELGIRLALGAARPRLIRLVLSRALGMVFWGLVFGAFGVWVTTRIISGLLFGVEPMDPPTLFWGTTVLVLSGVAAGLLPSLRGTRLSPVAALKSE